MQVIMYCSGLSIHVGFYRTSNNNYTVQDSFKSVSQSTYIIVDIDECSLEIADCDQNCINTAGGYDCMCFDGYSLDTSNGICEGMFSLEKNLII